MISAFDQIISSGRTELDRHAEHFLVDRVREPLVVDFGDGVAGAEDDVDELVAVMRLGQPVGEGDLGLEAGALQHVENALQVARADEDVEVLRRCARCRRSTGTRRCRRPCTARRCDSASRAPSDTAPPCRAWSAADVTLSVIVRIACELCRIQAVRTSGSPSCAPGRGDGRLAIERQFEDQKRRPIGIETRQQRHARRCRPGRRSTSGLRARRDARVRGTRR